MKQIVLAMMAVALINVQMATAQSRVKNLYTETQTLKVEQVQDTKTPVQVNRYLYAGYNTLCLPMTLSAQQLAAAARDIRVERLEAIRQEGTTLQLFFVDCTSEGIEAGKPYLLFSPTRQYLRVKNTESDAISTNIHAVLMDDGQGNRVLFSSSWNKRQKDGLYGIPAQQDKDVLESVLIRTTEQQSFLPTRCGFSWEQQSPTAEKLEIVHANRAGTTGLKGLKRNADNNGRYYDLNGRNVNNPSQKGVYIHDGKQVVVK
jgi:hypothetical protein